MSKTTEIIYKTFDEVLKKDNRTVVMLGVSGVGIPMDLSSEYPGRFIDAGIMEQSIVGIASGMAISGMIPIIFGQSAFFVERAYEQLKDDFGYQKVGGNFVLYGGSAEMGTFGATHCCPAALMLLSAIPGMEIVVPGRPEEFATLFMESYNNNCPTVYRTSLFQNSYNVSVSYGKANVIQKGTKATIVAIGPMLELAIRAFGDEDVTILYYTTVVPFDEKTLRENLTNERILLMEPSYQAGIMPIICRALAGEKFKTEFVGYPLEFIINHGFVVENLQQYELTVEDAKEKYYRLLK